MLYETDLLILWRCGCCGSVFRRRELTIEQQQQQQLASWSRVDVPRTDVESRVSCTDGCMPLGDWHCKNLVLTAAVVLLYLLV